MSTSPLVFDVQAQTSGAVAGFKRLAASILPVTKSADAAGKSIDKLSSKKVAPKADTAAIRNIKTEIDRLYDEISKAKSLDVDADTREAQRKIRALQTTLRALQRPTIDPQVRPGFMAKVKSGLTGLTSGLKTLGGGISKVVSNIGVPLVGAIGVAAAGLATGIGLLAAKSLTLADNVAQAQTRLKIFTGSTKKASAALKVAKDYADTQPFEFPEIQNTVTSLAGLGMSTKDINKNLVALGDIAAASGAPIEQLSTIYAQMASSGKVNTEDFNQLIDANVTGWKELASAAGLSVPATKKAVEEGKIGVDVLFDYLAKKRKGAAGDMANTLTGQVSNLKSAFDNVLLDIGEALLPFAKVLVPQITKSVEGVGAQVAKALPGWVDQLAEAAKALIDAGGQIMIGMKDVTVGVINAIAGFQDSMALLQRSFGDVLTGLAIIFSALPGMDGIAQSLADAGTNLITSSEDMKTAADNTRTEATKAAASWDKWIAAYNAGAAKAKTAISATQLKSALIFSTGNAQTTFDSVKKKWTAAKAALEKNPANPKLKARVEELDAKRKKAKAWLEQLNKYVANPKLLAKDLASGKVKVVKGKLEQVNGDKATVKLNADDNASGTIADVDRKRRNLDGSSANIKVTTTYSTRGNPKGTTADKGPGANMVAPTAYVPAPVVNVAAPQITLHLRDERLADLIDIRVDGKAARAAHVVGRRRGVLL